MGSRRTRPRIHLTAIAGSVVGDLGRLGVEGVAGLVALAQRGAGSAYEVTARPRMILSKEDELRGGRADDAARARETQAALADDNIAALVTLRGGAWFTRILDRIDFDVLRRRRRTLHIFGFSEMTPLIAIAGQYPKVVGLYDLGPLFLYGGRRRQVLKNIKQFTRSIELPAGQEEGFACGYALARFPEAFADFFREVADILDGKSSPRVPSGRLLAGTLPAASRITITGGNLSLLPPLLASPYAKAIETRGKWLAMEDVNEDAGSIDRMMAALKLGGLFDRVAGVILGDFHDDKSELSSAAFEILKHHLPPRRRVPVVAFENFGHIYPIAPLPLHREMTLRCEPPRRGTRRVTIQIPWADWARQ